MRGYLRPGIFYCPSEELCRFSELLDVVHRFQYVCDFFCSVLDVLITVKSSIPTEKMMIWFCMRQWKRHMSASDWTNLCFCSSVTTALRYVCLAPGVSYMFLLSLRTAWGCLKVPSNFACCLTHTALLPEWSNCSWRYAAFMAMCSMYMLNVSARANRIRTVVLSAIYVVVFFGVKVYSRYHLVPSGRAPCFSLNNFPFCVAFVPVPHREWYEFGVFGALLCGRPCHNFVFV